MRVNLQAQGLWHALELEDGETIEPAPRDAGISLHQAHRAIGLGGNQIPSSWCTASAGIQHRAAWWKELSKIRFQDGESVDDFSMRITGLANSITTLGESISETEIVKKMLQVVPDHLEQAAISIETLLDVNDLTVEEVTGRLRNVEQRKKNTVALL